MIYLLYDQISTACQSLTPATETQVKETNKQILVLEITNRNHNTFLTSESNNLLVY